MLTILSVEHSLGTFLLVQSPGKHFEAMERLAGDCEMSSNFKAYLVVLC